MSEDKKEFYKKQLNADISNLSIANMVLKNLAARWDDKAEEILSIIKSIREYQALLNVEGHIGYHPKVKETEEEDNFATAADGITTFTEEQLKTNKEAAELAKEVEAKRLAAEKAKEEKEALKAEKAAKKAELEAELAELEE